MTPVEALLNEIQPQMLTKGVLNCMTEEDLEKRQSTPCEYAA